MSLPCATMLLISYNQENYIEQALSAALAQDYGNLEIVVSDDASTDGTYERILSFCKNYTGPHRLVLNRNEYNLGIGANLSKAVSLSSGELFFITAGDDISLPDRVSRVVQFWMDHDQQHDLIACYLLDMDENGVIGQEIRIADLSAYRSLDDWAVNPPHVIGAAQAWTARLFEYFGGIPAGVVGEDMVMAFRAVGLGTAITYPHPVIQYRRGGLTTQKKAVTVQAVIKGLTRKVHSSQIELHAMLDAAKVLGAGPRVQVFLKNRLRREQYIDAMFNGPARIWTMCSFPGVSLAFRLRVALYALCPRILEPLFFLKRKMRERNKV